MSIATILISIVTILASIEQVNTLQDSANLSSLSFLNLSSSQGLTSTTGSLVPKVGSAKMATF